MVFSKSSITILLFLLLLGAVFSDTVAKEAITEELNPGEDTQKNFFPRQRADCKVEPEMCQRFEGHSSTCCPGHFCNGGYCQKGCEKKGDDCFHATHYCCPGLYCSGDSTCSDKCSTTSCYQIDQVCCPGYKCNRKKKCKKVCSRTSCRRGRKCCRGLTCGRNGKCR